MKGLFYEFLLRASRVTGTWFIAMFAWIVSCGYFLLRPAMVANSVRFYRAVFPDMGILSLWMLAWRQFTHFSTVFVDRVRLGRDPSLTCSTVGMSDFERARAQGHGAIFVMSHFGNWEIAARVFARRGVSLELHLGRKRREQVEEKQKHDLAHAGIRVVSDGKDDWSPFGLLESIRVLRDGGFVSIAGDRVQDPRQKQMEADFLRHRTRVPVAPHLLAMLSGAPIFLLFTVREGRGRYTVSLEGPFHVPRPGPEGREAALAESVQSYLRRLEEMVRLHPEHWYHFEPFLIAGKSDSTSPDASAILRP